jgi:hypothetical protein
MCLGSTAGKAKRRPCYPSWRECELVAGMGRAAGMIQTLLLILLVVLIVSAIAGPRWYSGRRGPGPGPLD